MAAGSYVYAFIYHIREDEGLLLVAKLEKAGVTFAKYLECIPSFHGIGV